ncbi:erythromycin esterase family protein [Nocardiopsis alba]|uniref:erythromycin esterase family protein n=1 Tax=Nocardiopsis alba TaxID=53437 RepID=UPI0035DF2CAE
MTPTSPFSSWSRDHFTPLAHLDPDAPLDDLEPLRALIGDARVVAVGENSHFIEEFSAVRRRMLRFLVERCGFTVLAFEYGFAEGHVLDSWARGEGTEEDLTDHLASAVPVGVDAPLRWVREHNRRAERPVGFAGVDVPAAGGSLLPALSLVAGYLRRVDPEFLPEVEEAMRIASSFAGPSAAAAAPRWERLDPAERNALGALLSRLTVRFRSVEPLYVSRGGRRDYDVALRTLEVAAHTDYSFRAMADLFAGRGRTADVSARDHAMAASLLWHLERGGPETRIVLAAHNAHILKSPVLFDGRLTGFPMGHYLHDALGEDYFSLALTGVTGNTADMVPEEMAPFGFTVHDTGLEAPAPGSVEAVSADEDLGPGLVDLRPRRSSLDGSEPDRTRLQSSYLHVPVVDAFDAVLNTETSTVVADVLG